MDRVTPRRAISQLAEYRQWITWRYEARDGKATKIPKNPHTGLNASSTDPETWDRYEQALAARERYHHDGLGFAFHPQATDIMGIDFDHCVKKWGD